MPLLCNMCINQISSCRNTVLMFMFFWTPLVTKGFWVLWLFEKKKTLIKTAINGIPSINLEFMHNAILPLPQTLFKGIVQHFWNYCHNSHCHISRSTLLSQWRGALQIHNAKNSKLTNNSKLLSWVKNTMLTSDRTYQLNWVFGFANKCPEGMSRM